MHMGKSSINRFMAVGYQSWTTRALVRWIHGFGMWTVPSAVITLFSTLHIGLDRLMVMSTANGFILAATWAIRRPKGK